MVGNNVGVELGHAVFGRNGSFNRRFGSGSLINERTTRLEMQPRNRLPGARRQVLEKQRQT